MNLSESILTAFDSLMANKMRAILTMLGVIIGVGAVIALMAIGNGFGAFVTGQIQSLGTNLLTISTNTDVSNGYQTLSMSDAQALANPANAPHISDVAATVQANKEVVYQDQKTQTQILGVTANYFEMNNLTSVAQGDLFTQQDVDARARVAVLGASATSTLFNNTYPVGEAIKINGVDYRVVGVLTSKGGSQFLSPDERVYIPLTTAQVYVNPTRTRKGELAVSAITVTALDAQSTDAAKTEITNTLRGTHDIIYAGEDDFRILSQLDLLSTFTTITQTLTLFLGAIAGISLLVGGIGIMNIMLVSVTERTREIGIRKAVGALRRDILAQFLIEALVLSLIGGVLGIVMGWALTLVAAPLMQGVTPVIDIGTILLATGFAATVGLVFGIYPAWRAARLRPIEALRYE